jgi:hypothetical protein
VEIHHDVGSGKDLRDQIHSSGSYSGKKTLTGGFVGTGQLSIMSDQQPKLYARAEMGFRHSDTLSVCYPEQGHAEDVLARDRLPLTDRPGRAVRIRVQRWAGA